MLQYDEIEMECKSHLVSPRISDIPSVALNLRVRQHSLVFAYINIEFAVFSSKIIGCCSPGLWASIIVRDFKAFNQVVWFVQVSKSYISSLCVLLIWEFSACVRVLRTNVRGENRCITAILWTPFLHPQGKRNRCLAHQPSLPHMNMLRKIRVARLNSIYGFGVIHSWCNYL